MPRPALVNSDDLLARLSFTFRDVGFEAASMSVLSERTGLKRASLYHRFPGGKQEMAEKVLSRAHEWMSENVIASLRSSRDPEERLTTMMRALEDFYENGARACLLNMLATDAETKSPFADAIRQTLEEWIGALAFCARSAGISEAASKQRALRIVTMIQGGLVVSRGLRTNAPFGAVIEDLPRVLLEREA
ncbi:hypothetical protein B7H23_04660 [Notoacmeibacter marinus]|uniref:Uncharacterized protein n=1 Tax=Notoacmeibacter marinus TaxID=1876515 RepID=A0A231V2E9_9HYPH|nr:TetR/AcrR family transcriptional regulator [Notoacmeibacter marinus]OXT02211.1 hypothetical protein B7H23_04660 [Notoacmeibacter marinus]